MLLRRGQKQAQVGNGQKKMPIATPPPKHPGHTRRGGSAGQGHQTEEGDPHGDPVRSSDIPPAYPQALPAHCGRRGARTTPQDLPQEAGGCADSLCHRAVPIPVRPSP